MSGFNRTVMMLIQKNGGGDYVSVGGEIKCFPGGANKNYLFFPILSPNSGIYELYDISLTLKYYDQKAYRATRSSLSIVEVNSSCVGKSGTYYSYESPYDSEDYGQKCNYIFGNGTIYDIDVTDTRNLIGRVGETFVPAMSHPSSDYAFNFSHAQYDTSRGYFLVAQMVNDANTNECDEIWYDFNIICKKIS